MAPHFHDLFGVAYDSIAIVRCALMRRNCGLHNGPMSVDRARSSRLIVTMEVLVLSLLIASAKTAFDMRRNDLVEISAGIILLDRELARYRSETMDTRALLRRSLVTTLERVWPAEVRPPPTKIEPAASTLEAVYDKIED